MTTDPTDTPPRLPPSFIHIGLPKAASSWLQLELFRRSPDVNFLGLIRDHDALDIDYQPPPATRAFDLFVRGKSDDRVAAEGVRALLSPSLPTVISDEDFSTDDRLPVAEKLRRIHAILPEGRILVVLRNPLDLIRSFHGFYVRGGKVTTDLDTWVRGEIDRQDGSTVLKTARIQRLVESCHAVFGHDRVFLLNFDALKADPAAFRATVCDLIGCSVPTGAVARRNEGLPPAAVALASRLPQLWRTRALLPRDLRRGVKRLMGRIPYGNMDFDPSTKRLLQNIFADDISFVIDSLGFDWTHHRGSD